MLLCSKQHNVCVCIHTCLQVFHMERSSTSLLNLQNTLPLFRYAGYCCARTHALLLPAGTATLHAVILPHQLDTTARFTLVLGFKNLKPKPKP